MLCQWRTVCKWNMQIACSCITWKYRMCYVFMFRVFGLVLLGLSHTGRGDRTNTNGKYFPRNSYQYIHCFNFQ